MKEEIEVWKDVHEYEGLYKVSSFGRVKRITTNKLRLAGNNGMGYLFIPLCKNGIVKNHYIHRLVAIHFVPNPKKKSTVNHKNGIKSDNNITNLEWCTQSENSQHGFDTGLICQKKGAENSNSKPVIQYDLDGNKLNEFISITEASMHTGIYASNIGLACSKRVLRAGDFQWRYKHQFKDVSSIGKKGNGEKKVICFDKNMNLIKTYNSLSEAAYKTGGCLSSIGDNCRGKLKTSGGFIWKFKE